ncbi:uncharacterized protein LOC135083970 [Ostrinia nubilalis]|uniref:uncharacterized protein LOC135083970 n=1 Tax=Ostrinia nubilalis TaxID=29057 RepID=UPI0030823099
MDYVIGSVAALISGNVTPNRPKLIRRALTPTKHQPSPNVTPKSEFVDDRSIFLSPTLQKKKAIVKKSPKRIFQNPDLDVTSDNDNSSDTSPKAEKVKKHLVDELDGDDGANKSSKTNKSPKKSDGSPKKSKNKEFGSPQSANETTPKKQKKNKKSVAETSQVSEETVEMEEVSKSPKKNRKRLSEDSELVDQNEENVNEKKTSKKKKKLSIAQEESVNQSNFDESDKQVNLSKSQKKKNKKKKSKAQKHTVENASQAEDTSVNTETKQKNKNKSFVNPNAITDKDSDSEHESDDEIVSENEEANKEMLDTGPVEESSDEEETPETKKTENKDKSGEPRTEDEIKRTLFVGNVLFTKKCKKEVKKIFSKYGDIETVRIRTVPVKDARVTPKLAVIRNELHPERTTVNVYIKYKNPSSVEQALVENNTVLNDCHLRVSRSDSTGAQHDPRCSIFVGNVPFALEDEALRAKFEQCGEIESVRIVRDKKTNAGKGFAYVNFASKDGVELALALTEEDLTIKNRILRVKRCTQLTQNQKNQTAGNGRNLQGRNQSFQGRNQGFQGKNQGFKGKNQNFPPKNQGGRFGGKGGFKSGQGQSNDAVGEGAHRRIMNKRKFQESGDGPPSKRPNQLNQPQKEKKTRKEFVGMTAEKKKKHTFNKGQKKRKALSEILTK